jgi:GT2 family glycosyltransferase
VSAVIVNRNRSEQLLNAIASLKRGSVQPRQLIVVDNGSSDSSIQALATKQPDCNLIRLEGNHGFCVPSNLGIKAALADRCSHVLMVNNDATVDAGMLEHLLKALAERPTLGIVAPLVRNESGVVWSGGGLIENWHPVHIQIATSDPGYSSRLVDWVSGCVCLVRREVFENVPGLHNDYFAYFEDVDFCLEARDRGLLSAVVPNAQATHHVDNRETHDSLRVYLMERNRLIWLRRRSAPGWVIARSVIVGLRTAIAWTVRARYRSLRPSRAPLIFGIFDGLVGAATVRYTEAHT